MRWGVWGTRNAASGIWGTRSTTVRIRLSVVAVVAGGMYGNAETRGEQQQQRLAGRRNPQCMAAGTAECVRVVEMW